MREFDFPVEINRPPVCFDTWMDRPPRTPRDHPAPFYTWTQHRSQAYPDEADETLVFCAIDLAIWRKMEAENPAPFPISIRLVQPDG